MSTGRGQQAPHQAARASSSAPRRALTIEEWIRSAGRKVRHHISDITTSLRTELVDVGAEMRQVGKEAYGLAASSASGLRQVPDVVTDTVVYSVDTVADTAISAGNWSIGQVSSAKGVLGQATSKAWGALDTLDDFMTQALLDVPDREEPKPDPSRLLEFEVRMFKRPGDKIGVGLKWLEDEKGPVAVIQVKEGLLLDQWNRNHTPGVKVVRPGDFLVSANGVSLVGQSCEEKRRLLSTAFVGDPLRTNEVVLGITRVTTSGSEFPG